MMLTQSQQGAVGGCAFQLFVAAFNFRSLVLVLALLALYPREWQHCFAQGVFGSGYAGWAKLEWQAPNS